MEGDEDEDDDYTGMNMGMKTEMDKRISSGEIRKLMEDFGDVAKDDKNEEGKDYDDEEEEEEEEAEEEEEEEETRLGAVMAGNVKMLGPWVDMDEVDVMYKVPVDKDGKVKRRRKRNRHR